MNPEELFEKLMNNKISKEEFERLLDGLEDEDLLARYEVYLRSQFEKEVEKHFEEMESETDDKPANLTITKGISPKSKDKKNKRDFPLAAIFVIFVGLAFSILFILSQSQISVTKPAIASATILPEVISKTTPKGRKFRMTLDDGSFVHMNAASSITYPNKFGTENRDIEIVGEVYFDITRDESRSFNIKVKDYTVKVLGTSFNVQAYEDEDDFSVTVESGSVKVDLDESGMNSFVLETNQKLIYNPLTNVTEVIEVNTSYDLSWRSGILRFDSTPMSQVAKMLERWYGVDIVIESANLRNKKFTGVHKNENIKSVIQALTYATRSAHKIKDNSIIIKN